jgi:hypothetical protein
MLMYLKCGLIGWQIIHVTVQSAMGLQVTMLAYRFDGVSVTH